MGEGEPEPEPLAQGQTTLAVENSAPQLLGGFLVKEAGNTAWDAGASGSVLLALLDQRPKVT